MTGKILVVEDERAIREMIALYLLNQQYEVIEAEDFLRFAVRWFYKSSGKYPLSFEFARLGLSNKIQPLYQSVLST